MSHDTLSQNPSEGLTRSGGPAVRFYTASLDSRTLTLAVHGKRPLPLLILNSEQQTESFYEALFKACHRKGAKAFNLLVISGFDWNADLSPWFERITLHGTDSVFNGRAEDYLNWIESRVLLWSKSILTYEIPWTGLIGYSMAGLFALYGALSSSCFDCTASVSGSLWYPELTEWIQNQEIPSSLEALYFSIGTKESRTSDPYLKTTESITRGLSKYFSQAGLNCAFEENPGNHFYQPDERLAKSIAWLTHAMDSVVKNSKETSKSQV